MNFTTNAIYLCLNSEMTSVACGMDLGALGVLWADGLTMLQSFLIVTICLTRMN